jgi:hypothetical protein
MRSYVRMICVIGLSLFATNRAKAQYAYRLLTADDFKGAPRSNKGDNSVAFTHCSVDFGYRVIGENNHYNLTFDVRLTMDRQLSWLDKKHILSKQMLAEILNHEQGHYTIAYMEQQEILREANRMHFDANYKEQASALFNRIHYKYEQLNVNYDTDTMHSLDHVQQHSWDVYFQRRLMYMPPVNAFNLDR